MNETSDHRWKILCWIAITLLTPVGLIAMLVGTSFLEFKLTRTQRIEEVCRAIHIHEPIRQASAPWDYDSRVNRQRSSWTRANGPEQNRWSPVRITSF